MSKVYTFGDFNRSSVNNTNIANIFLNCPSSEAEQET
jgi:hypothetical protein